MNRSDTTTKAKTGVCSSYPHETCREELCCTWHSHPREQRVYTAIAVAPYSPEAIDFLLEVAGDAESYAKGAVAENAILGLWRLIRDED